MFRKPPPAVDAPPKLSSLEELMAIEAPPSGSNVDTSKNTGYKSNEEVDAAARMKSIKASVNSLNYLY